MRVLVCPTAFADTLTAVQAAEAIAAGWAARAPHDDLVLAPLGDGGAGFLDTIERARGGVTVATTVSDPLGREVPAAILLVDDGGRQTAYVEAAQACGLHLLGASERDPGVTSTYGVGQLVACALDEGATRVVVGVGPAATYDGGAGLLGALGAGVAHDLSRGGLPLAGLDEDALAELGSVRARLRGVELVLATDDTSALLGAEGATAAAQGRGDLGRDAAMRIDAALATWADRIHSALPPSTDLLTGLGRRLDREPGAGAGGGLGLGLLALGARRVSAVEEILRAWDLPSKIDAADLVVTGIGRFDWTCLRDGLVSAVAQVTAQRAIPVILVAADVQVGRREWMALGLAGCYNVCDTSAAAAAYETDPLGILRARAERVATTWSPR